jgi:hypothetical protein
MFSELYLYLKMYMENTRLTRISDVEMICEIGHNLAY